MANDIFFLFLSLSSLALPLFCSLFLAPRLTRMQNRVEQQKNVFFCHIDSLPRAQKETKNAKPKSLVIFDVEQMTGAEEKN